MTPYQEAYTRYHADGQPAIPWIEAIDFHLQYGTIIADGNMFAMIRGLPENAPPHEHPQLITHAPPKGSTAHVWSAAGDLVLMLKLARAAGIQTVTFQRRNNRLHKASISRLLRAACSFSRRKK